MSKPGRCASVKVIIVLLVTALAVASGYRMPVAYAQSANRASLVVVFGPDDVFSSCVTFTESEISGIELLRRAGLSLVSQQVAGVGESVCKMEEVGCNYPGEACFCRCLGSPCNYWSYWTWSAGEWIYAGRGASQTLVQPGAINAWVWGDGQTEPPAIGSEGVCGGASLQQDATNTPEAPTADTSYNPYPEGTQQVSEPTATSEAAATPELSPTPESYPAGTILPSYPAVGTEATTNTPQAGTATATTTLPAEATTVPAEVTTTRTTPKPTVSPDRSASIVARAATNAAATGEPQVSPEAAEKRSYWAFLGIALLLTVAILYVLLLRRQRARNKQP